MILVIIRSMHVQQCRAMQIGVFGVCMHTIDLLFSSVHLQLQCAAHPHIQPSLDVLALLESVSKPCVMLTGVREGWASAKSA